MHFLPCSQSVYQEQSLEDMAHKKIYEPLSVYSLFQRDAINSPADAD